MDIINRPLGWVLKMCSQLFGNNYMFAILLFAIIVEILFLPFGIKQQKNSIKQARLRPKEAAIRKKYAGRDDKPTQQKMNTEIQDLYQKEGYNPMGGCLPLIIQMVLLYALYFVVVDPLKYISGLSTDAIGQIQSIANVKMSRGSMELLAPIRDMGYAPFANVEGFTHQVFDKIPNLNIFGVLDLSMTPLQCLNVDAIKTFQGWMVLMVPIFTFVSYFFSMKMTRKLSYQPEGAAQMGCSNKIMDIVMPLFSVFISFGVPAALGVYWIFRSILGVVKQVGLYYAMPLPKFTEEDMKAAEKEMNARAEASSKTVKSGRVVRSLHHIDDEDFDDTAEAAKLRREALEAQEAAEAEKRQAAVKRNKFISDGAVKKDDAHKERTADGEKKKASKKDKTKNDSNDSNNAAEPNDGKDN